MGNDMFGGLMKGLSSVLPQDDPNIKKFTAQSKINDLKEEETGIYAELGKKVMEEEPGKYPGFEERLRAVRMELSEAESGAKKADMEAKEAEKVKEAETAKRTCPGCGTINEEGVKFCSECGTEIGQGLTCPGCGAALSPGTKFCGSCGTKVGE